MGGHPTATRTLGAGAAGRPAEDHHGRDGLAAGDGAAASRTGAAGVLQLHQRRPARQTPRQPPRRLLLRQLHRRQGPGRHRIIKDGTHAALLLRPRPVHRHLHLQSHLLLHAPVCQRSHRHQAAGIHLSAAQLVQQT